MRKIQTAIYFVVTIFLVLLASCNTPLDGSKAAYLDQQLLKVENSLARRGHHSTAEQSFLDSILPGMKGTGLNQVAHKYIIAAIASKRREDKILYADSAMALLETRLNSSEKTARLFSRAAGLKASLYFEVESYDQAIRNYTLQKIALAQVKDSCKQIDYYENMARILFAQRKYLSAVPYFKMVTHLTEKCRPVHAYTIIQEHLDNIGLCYRFSGKYDSANYYYNAALDFIEQNKDGYEATPDRNARIPLMKAVIYGNQGGLFLVQKKYPEAEAYASKSLDMVRDKDSQFAIGCRMSLLKIFLQTNQLNKVAVMRDEVIASLDTSAITGFSFEFNKASAQYYQKRGHPDLAYYYLAKAEAFRDSIVAKDRKFVALDMAREFENKEQKSINEALKKDNKLQQSYLLIFVISTVLACTIAILVWYSLKRKSLYVARLKKLNTEVELKNEDLLQTLQSLEESHAENTRLLRTVAHDLRNPVGAIRTLAYSLSKRELPVMVREALELIQSTCTDSLTLIKDLLEHKKEASDIPNELVDMGRLIEQCSQILQLKAGEKNQQIILDVEHPKIPANREKLHRVISNLVNNAIKFSPDHSEIKIGLQIKEKSIVVSVQDHGMGIPLDLHDKILNMSPEGSRKGTAGEESYGLGLSICKKIVQEHRGHLWFESEEGKGSVFFVELPAER